MTIDFKDDLIKIVKDQIDFNLDNAVIDFVDFTNYAFFVILKNEDKYCFVNLNPDCLKFKRVYLSSNMFVTGKFVVRRFNEFFYHSMVNYKIVEACDDCVKIKKINPGYIVTTEKIEIENANEVPIFFTTIALLKSNLTHKEIEKFLLNN